MLFSDSLDTAGAYSIWKINKRMAKEVLPSKAVLTLAVHAMGSSGKVEERTK